LFTALVPPDDKGLSVDGALGKEENREKEEENREKEKER